MRIPEHNGEQVVRWYLLNSEEVQFWMAVAIQRISERKTILIAMEEADKATLELIKRR
jgi:hypothetical protein